MGSGMRVREREGMNAGERDARVHTYTILVYTLVYILYLSSMLELELSFSIIFI